MKSEKQAEIDSYDAKAKQKELTQNLRNTLYTISERLTIQAIPNIVADETRRFMRVIWSIFLVAMTAICAYFVAVAIQRYFEYKVDTVIEIVRENSFEFPTITFCNLQICGFKDYDFSSYLKKYKQDEQEKFGSNQDAQIDEKLRKDNTKTSFFSAKEVFLRKYEDNELMKILNKSRESINKMLISCKFGDEECGENDFQFYQMGEFLKCYRFNSGYDFNDTYVGLKNTTRFGQQYGFKMELYTGTQDECKSPLSSSSGLIIYIHNVNTLTEEDNGILVKPGTETNIALDRTTVKKLPAPYSDCFEKIETYSYKKSQLIQNTINLTGSYSQQYCLQLCYQGFLIEFCDCYDHTLPNFKPEGKSPCPKFIDSLYNCQYLIEKLFYNGKNDEYCLKECPKECDYTQFDTTISSLQYPSKGYHEIIKEYNSRTKLINDGQLEAEGTLSVNIFYASGSYTKIQEKASVEIANLLPDVGGHLGLFLGVSALTAVEIIEILYEICYTLFKKCSLKLSPTKKIN